MVSVVVRKLEPLSLGSKGTLPAFNMRTIGERRTGESRALSGVPHISSHFQQGVIFFSDSLRGFPCTFIAEKHTRGEVFAKQIFVVSEQP